VSCAINIDGQLEDTDGVKEAITNYAKQCTEVTYDETKIDSKKLASIVKQAGYSATPLE
jgi:copper chaperone CopZ